MTAWIPEPGEIVLSQDVVGFATGAAPKVSGMRWFRDFERNDIQDQLPGWPEGRTYTPRTERQRRSRSAGRFGLHALYALVVGGLETLAGSGSIAKGPTSLDAAPEDPENEVEDFPVMWADTGTLARTLPWQLDRTRRPVAYRTFAVVTDQRLVVLGSPKGDQHRTEYLWACDRADIADAKNMPFSNDRSDVVIRFTDRSWCRIQVASSGIDRYLVTPHELISHHALNSAQRQTVDAFMTKHEFDLPPVISRRPSGNFLIEGHAGNEPRPRRALTAAFQFMGPHGETVEAQPGDC
ncbi:MULTISPECIES: hypothetical protein [unclassified Streptomyces]|uniref:hypothetical protein n=1 Tax=unclassified Streptomyces TaxID=2593676 RepID=UPI0033AA7C5B